MKEEDWAVETASIQTLTRRTPVEERFMVFSTVGVRRTSFL